MTSRYTLPATPPAGSPAHEANASVPTPINGGPIIRLIPTADHWQASRTDSIAAYAPDITKEFETMHRHLGALTIALRKHSDRLDQVAASGANTRIIGRNSRVGYLDFQLLQKTVPGHGLALAHAAAWCLGPTIQQSIKAPPDPPAIGTTPRKLRPCILDYGYADVLEVIIFYNSDFGVVPGETQVAWARKFGDFLSLF